MTDTGAGLVLKSVRLPSGEGPIDIRVSAGRIAEIGDVRILGTDVVEDVGGALVIPALTDAHCHVDKTVWGSGRWLSHMAGATLADRIANNARVRDEWGIPNVEYTRNLLSQIVVNGTVRIRTHTDIDVELGLRGVEMVNSLASEFAGMLDIQQVAFPQRGLFGNPRVAELIEEAVGSGVSVIGGIDPAGRDRDPVGSLNEIFGLATRTGTEVDIHLHDRGSLGTWQIELVCERTKSEGMQGRVTLSHAYSLGDVAPTAQMQLAEMLADAGVGIVTAIPFNSPVLPLKLLADAGVNVAFGNDSIRNTWSPFGTADMLQRTMIAGTRYEARRDDELRTILAFATEGGARIFGARKPEVAVGGTADLVIVDALNEYDAVVSVPPRKLVIKAGVIVAREGQIVHNEEERAS